jgi:hypothetical protein
VLTTNPADAPELLLVLLVALTVVVALVRFVCGGAKAGKGGKESGKDAPKGKKAKGKGKKEQ